MSFTLETQEMKVATLQQARVIIYGHPIFSSPEYNVLVHVNVVQVYFLTTFDVMRIIFGILILITIYWKCSTKPPEDMFLQV
mgnify:CR=1 FL=1